MPAQDAAGGFGVVFDDILYPSLSNGLWMPFTPKKLIGHDVWRTVYVKRARLHLDMIIGFPLYL
jgi:hypothetical protein